MTSPRVRALAVSVSPFLLIVFLVACGGGSSGGGSGNPPPPPPPVTNVNVNIDVLANRHFISPFVYGVNFPPDAAYITNTNTPLVRWGGNASSTYNWQLGTNKSDNDYFFEDFTFSALSNPADADSAQFIKDVKGAGGHPLMTMPMLNWVAQSAENGVNGHWSFSAVKYGPQCHTDQFNSDAGNGVEADCSTQTTTNDPNDAYFPLLDDHTQACPSGNCVYRIDWVTDPAKGLTQAFGGGACPVPYFTNGSCHFYDMDNEIDIWGGKGATHFDIHQSPATYDELRDVYLAEATKTKNLGPAGRRLWMG